MIFRGEPVVPPTCPAVAAYKHGRIGGAEIDCYTYAYENDANGNPTTTEVCVDFMQNGETFLELRAPRVPIDSDAANKARVLEKAIQEGETSRRERMQELLSQRVANCQGIVNGECWALGPTALREVLIEVSPDPDANTQA